MNYDTFVDQVAQRTGLDPDRAVQLIHATLRTLAERLTGGEVLDLAAQLPDPLRLALRTGPDDEAAERFDAREFGARVGERADADEATARAAARAVLTTLREAVTGDEFDDVVTQLPRDYRDLVEPAMSPGVGLRRA
ncbi:DUF2267 domain-containing protein [Micromonospora mirobrigensis]|uniref:Uncharacterized conserved protein, DUF2267 family n=1 Tax=Micromonospora mirobrigensis TaxID=262898 RepID=A0A1C4YU64_9ACTN|nr:DUF2267 domain-containing protein [Micromonospora mirobrigensis]SCF24312.1 Uncharacterized conserved protein, DUF2267 family [Micromonospora mirobrigensis]